MDAPWLLLPGLYVVDEDEDGNEKVLSGPWFSDEDAEDDRRTWSNADELAVVGWLRQ
jgi:hypothetical protein